MVLADVYIHLLRQYLILCLVPALNSECSKATPVELDSWVHVPLANAARVNSAWPGFCADSYFSYFRITGNSVWFSFVGNGKRVKIASV